jgi:hypothetical protein
VCVGESWSWGRGKWQAAGAIFVVGKAVLTLHPPLRPLSHNVNPRDGAQDIPELDTEFRNWIADVLVDELGYTGGSNPGWR